MPACVQCLAATDCGTDIDCRTFACSATGQCMTNNVPNGTPLLLQPAGDCKTAVCNGSGGTTTIVNANDVPVDGNDCTFDVCTNSQPVQPTARRERPLQPGHRQQPLQRQRDDARLRAVSGRRRLWHRHRLPDVRVQRHRRV